MANKGIQHRGDPSTPVPVETLLGWWLDDLAARLEAEKNPDQERILYRRQQSVAILLEYLELIYDREGQDALGEENTIFLPDVSEIEIDDILEFYLPDQYPNPTPWQKDMVRALREFQSWAVDGGWMKAEQSELWDTILKDHPSPAG